MGRLGSGADKLQAHYDVVVVGSGYGGGVAASRLARMGLEVAVLERGREYLPGDFPTDILGAERETQISLPSAHLGPATALFDMHVGKGAHVLVGCGLGGTSLINANVCIAPDPRVFADVAWPTAVRNDGTLAKGFERARAMLNPQPLPPAETPRKLSALAVSAKALGVEPGRVDLHIAFQEGVNTAGVRQPACTRCGDCMGGCNVGAKTTVHSTYLTDAANHGAELFTEACVRWIEKLADGRWRIAVHLQDDKPRRMPVRMIETEAIVLAAGTLGTNEILMRSRDRGLALSDRLGKRVSTNGDAISLGYNTSMGVGSIGVGHPPRSSAPPPGPAVAGLIDLRAVPKLDDGVVIVDAGVQSAYAALIPVALVAAGITGKGPARSIREALAAAGRAVGSTVGGAYSGAVDNTQVFLAIGHDTSAGEISFSDDRASLVWPHAADAPSYRRIDEIVGKAVAATGGTYVPNPVSASWLGGNVFSVHPLGGAAVGEDRGSAVVDHKGRVFDAAAKGTSDIHQGLFVMDGSVIARSLGVHPLLTITAFAERAMMHLAGDIGRNLDVSPKAGVTQRTFHRSLDDKGAQAPRPVSA
jgi:cholesterol oxidase